MKVLRFTVAFTIALVATVCVFSCATYDDSLLPSLPCRDGGTRMEDGKTVFDVPLNKLIGAPGISVHCLGQHVRTAGYLCFTGAYGPFLFESERAAEQNAWMVERMAWWYLNEPPQGAFDEEMLALWLPVDGLERYNGHQVTVRGVYERNERPTALEITSINYDGPPAPASVVAAAVRFQLTDPLESLKSPHWIPLCSGPRQAIPKPGTIQP